MRNIRAISSFQRHNSPQRNLGLRSTVVSSHKNTGQSFGRYFVFNKKQGLLTKEFKSAIFANCQILKGILWILKSFADSPN